MAHILLPQPQAVSPLEGAFTFGADTLILVPAHADEPVLTGARQLQDEILRTGGPLPALVKTLTPPRSEDVILLVCGEEQAAAWGIDPAPPDVPSGLAHVERIRPQAYTLTLEPGRGVLYAETPGALFYAIQTLRQLVRRHGATLPALSIQDWPILPYRGLMLDISRRKVPTLETLKELADQISHYKLNVFQLYTEHTFQFPRHPKIGAGCGSLSSQDIMELDAFCRARGVELMPNLQSFGHALNTLFIPEYQHLAETDIRWTLSPAFEGTYTLLDELYADMLPSFTSATLNVGCDETYDLGKGASKPLADEIGVGRLYLNHVLRVRELAARHGRRIQIWGDILLHHPELIGELPDDVTLLDWHYEEADEFPTAAIFERSGRTFWVCPAVNSWDSLFPRVRGANVNIRNFVRDGVAAGAEGMLNTDWGDHGHYQPLGASWYGYVFGAAQGWSGGTTSDEDFESAFGPLFLGVEHARILEALHQLDRTNYLPGMGYTCRSHTVLAFFDEPLTGETITSLPPETLSEMRALGQAAIATLDRLAPGHPQELTLREMASTARQTEYAARKVALSQEIRHSLRSPGLDADRVHGFIMALRGLDAELETLRAEFESLWLARARRSEIHVALGYYAGLRARYRAAVDWLQAQRQALLEGRAVDAELSTYDASGYRVLWQNWPD